MRPANGATLVQRAALGEPLAGDSFTDSASETWGKDAPAALSMPERRLPREVSLLWAAPAHLRLPDSRPLQSPLR